MTRPETPWEVNGPPTGRFTPADASSAAPPLKEVKQEAIAAAPLGLMWKSALAPSSSALTLEKKRLPSAAAAPFMLEVRKEKNSTAPAPAGTSSRMAAPTVDKRIHCTVGNENINGKKKPEMDFLGVAVDGSSKEDEEDDHLTLQSTGSNDRRSSGSVRSIGSNPNEKPMSPEEVAYTDKRIKELLEIMQSSWEARQKFLCRKQKKMERKIEKVQQMARECGASECTNLWPTVMDIACNERATKFFMASDPAGRLKIIKHYAGVKDLGGSQPCDIQRKPLLKRDAEENFEDNCEGGLLKLAQDYNNAAGFSYGTSCREVLPGGRLLSKPTPLPCSQGKQVSSSRIPKRNKTTSS
ncbi:hypothetical protein SORBI_3005G047900 [Sorghum bicolor]|uniref:Uncharacterized protein n=1 Tax=Sorghum bicolor TaxID=4558 RepID=A0A1Z5RGT0_SORBI|nr:hypothetical protein SORBI_3005G047900 [Sorghum bicolor]